MKYIIILQIHGRWETLGKVLVHIRPEDKKVTVSVPRLMQAYSQYFCNHSNTYIIVGNEFFNLIS
jgi:hypothetical protein